ncbi:MAG: hypothetical protein H6729_11225 [Deltaproteobacteria bacterium]|nr:hypothetical protein [Deltaproteobacteria bacterium]
MHPRYLDEWEMGVPAEEALFIAFGTASPNLVESTDFVAVGGKQLVLDSTGNGQVVGIEIV